MLLSSGLIFLHISAHEFKCKSIYLRIYESENDDTCADKSCLYGGRRPYYTTLAWPHFRSPMSTAYWMYFFAKIIDPINTYVHCFRFLSIFKCLDSRSVKNHQKIVMNYQLTITYICQLIILKKSGKRTFIDDSNCWLPFHFKHFIFYVS